MYSKLAITAVAGGTVGTATALAATGFPVGWVLGVGAVTIGLGVVARRLAVRRANR